MKKERYMEIVKNNSILIEAAVGIFGDLSEGALTEFYVDAVVSKVQAMFESRNYFMVVAPASLPSMIIADSLEREYGPQACSAVAFKLLHTTVIIYFYKKDCGVKVKELMEILGASGELAPEDRDSFEGGAVIVTKDLECEAIAILTGVLSETKYGTA